MRGYQDLANAIISQAVSDYRRALRNKHRYSDYSIPERRIAECEAFFGSDYFQILTNYDGERLLSRLKEEYNRECKTRAKHKKTYRNDFYDSIDMLR